METEEKGQLPFLDVLIYARTPACTAEIWKKKNVSSLIAFDKAIN